MNEKKEASASVLDLDFLIFALPYAVLIDVLDFVFEIGIIASLLAGGPLIIWLMVTAGKEVGIEDIRKRGAARQAAKAGARRALRRGTLVFIAELIPILNLVPFWIIVVVSTRRKKKMLATTPREEKDVAFTNSRLPEEVV